MIVFIRNKSVKYKQEFSFEIIYYADHFNHISIT